MSEQHSSNERRPRVVWITGASSGIGEHVARLLVRRGAVVVGTARRADRLDALAADLGDGFEAAPGDVTDRDALVDIAQGVRDRHGAIDVAIFSAGIWQQVGVEDYAAEVVQRHLDVNTMGVANGIEAVLADMLARGRGTIAGVASLAGYRGLPGAGGYSTSKAATITLLESLRIGAAPHGVRVVTINPGFVDTEMTAHNDFPMPFMVDVESAAQAVVRGLDRGRSEITFPLAMTASAKIMRLFPVSVYAAVFRRR